MLQESPILELEAAEPETGDIAAPVYTLRLMPGEFALVEARDTGRAELLADLCCGILPLTAGCVRFHGHDWTTLRQEQAASLRGRIGRVFASGGWIEFLDVGSNILLPQFHHTRRDRAALRDAASELARAFSLPGLPLGRPRELSGADLARAACVRALLCKPLLLLLVSPLQGIHADLVVPLLNGVAKVRDRGGAAIWLTRSDLVWADRSIPATHRLRLQDQGLMPVRRR
ncbi:MAG: ABC transporter ATP-binding protein [Acetobacteraceae bacterium]|nr:ABC transporter ATP-binding protein [Acetobacteraceae bacterium]